MASPIVVEDHPAPLDATADPPALFDGTTRLYTSYVCPFAQRVWITRNVKGLQEKIKLVPLDLGNRPAWYKEKVYPENKVPALEHNGKIIGESLDLIKYLDNTFEGPSLYPEDHAKRGFGDELLKYTDTFVKTMYVSLKGDPSKETAPVLDYLENALYKFDDGPFFLGQLSLVDIAYIPFIERFQIVLNELFKCDITAERPKLSAWIEEMNKIDGYAQTKINPKEIVEIFKKKFMVDSWIEFALSRNVQKTYSFPDSFYLPVKQLTVRYFCDMIIPSCTVSWKYLRNLSLCSCKLPDESIDNILSGCPILESLTLDTCRSLERLDLSKSPSLRRLDIDRHIQPSGPIVIVAPHIHYLRLTKTMKPSTLVDVSSLTEANLNIISSILYTSEADLFQTMELEMLAKSHNVKRLTVGKTLLQILSLAELRGVPFPTLKVQTLIVKTEFVRSIIPGISKLVLRNAKTLERMVVWLGGSYFNDAQWFEELLRMVETLSHNNNVSIVLKRSNC